MKDLNLEAYNLWELPEENVSLPAITAPIKTKYGLIDMDTRDPLLTSHIKRYEIEQVMLDINNGPFEKLSFEVIFNHIDTVLGKVNGYYFIGIKTMVEVVILCQLDDGWNTYHRVDSDESLAVVYDRCSEALLKGGIDDLVTQLETTKNEKEILEGWVTEIQSSQYYDLLVLLTSAYNHISKKQANTQNIQLDKRELTFLEQVSARESSSITAVIKNLINQEINKQGCY